MSFDPHCIEIFNMNFAKFFSMFNILGSLPVFMGVTALMPASMMRRTAFLVSMTALVGTYLFIFLGSSILSFFDVSLEAFRIAGAIVVAIAGYQMLTGVIGGDPLPVVEGEDPEAAHRKSMLFAITPLGIPLIFGPGCISLVISAAGDNLNDMGEVIWGQRIALMLALAAVTASMYLIFICGRRVRQVLGTQGTQIILKVMGLILMVMAIQMGIRGTTDVVKQSFQLETAISKEALAEKLNLNA